ncbi:MAG: ABC transporter substrate-binding protein [Bacteroidales bacterium]|jgi:ABC-type branched-subunit amino acid transport system substrate-binding protein|nr:ABC transporter substrate-binding protein [Bacteroidales bacterium]
MIIKKLHISWFLSLFLLVIGCEKFQEDYNFKEYKNPIKIGVVGDLTTGREVVENVFFGVKLAAEEINNSGGLTINNVEREIQLIYKNSAGTSEDGIKIIDELIDENVEIIIGPTSSEVAIAMAAKCIEKNILMITYSASVPTISTLADKDLIWRTCPSDEFSGMMMARFAADSLQKTRAAILYRDDTFGNGMKTVIQSKFHSINGEIVASASFPVEGVDINKYDFSPQIDMILAQEPQIIFTIIFEPEVGKITRDLWSSNLYHQYNEKPNLFLVEGGFYKELETNGQPEVIEMIYGISSSITNTDNYIEFKNNYYSSFGFNPLTYAEHAYDALYSIAYASQRSQSINPLVIKQYLRAVTGGSGSSADAVVINVNEFSRAKVLLTSDIDINYDGASGSLSFDQNGDPSSKFVIWKIEDGEYKEVTILER